MFSTRNPKNFLKISWKIGKLKNRKNTNYYKFKNINKSKNNKQRVKL